LANNAARRPDVSRYSNLALDWVGLGVVGLVGSNGVVQHVQQSREVRLVHFIDLSLIDRRLRVGVTLRIFLSPVGRIPSLALQTGCSQAVRCN